MYNSVLDILYLGKKKFFLYMYRIFLEEYERYW